MKKDWTYKKLGEICESDLGKTLNSKTDTGEYRPYLCAINVLWDKIDMSTLKTTKFETSELERYSVKKGDLLVCEGGDIGRAAIWNEDEPMQYQNALHRIRFNGDMLPRFFLMYLHNLKNTGVLDNNYGKGVTIKHLVKSSLLSIPVPVPPLSEQQHIVSELDLLQSIIDKQQAQLKEYDNLAQSIFYDMFGDPVENEKGWEISTLLEVSDGKLTYGSGASAKEYDGETRYIRITDIEDNGSLKNERVSPNEINSKYLLNDGDILFARSGATVGKTYQHKSNNGKCIYAGYLIRLIPNRKMVLPEYVFGFTKTAYYKSFVSMSQKAVAQPNINAEQYGNLKICVPPFQLQQIFAEKIEVIEKQKATIGQSIAETQKLYDYTTDKYFG